MNPLQLIAVFVAGWPAAIASLVLAVWGIAARQPRVTAIGAVVGTPFLLYFALTPRFALIGPVILVLYYGAALAAATKRQAVAAILVAPFVIFLTWVAHTVASQYGP